MYNMTLNATQAHDQAIEIIIHASFAKFLFHFLLLLLFYRILLLFYFQSLTMIVLFF